MPSDTQASLTRSLPPQSLNVDPATGHLINTSYGQRIDAGRVAGSTIIPINGNPTDDQGINGDFAFDMDTATLYGPKANGTWDLSSGFPIIGASGDKGVGIEDGYIDQQGNLMLVTTDEQRIKTGSVVGPAGKDGTPGKNGSQGIVGPQGLPGKDGGIGPIGLTGAPGKDGTNGKDGAVGPIGLTGLTGEKGLQGNTGAQGVKGDVGPKGETGQTGAAGKDGISITWKGSFPASPASPQLNWGYYNTTTKISYIYDGTAWQILAKDGAASFIMASGTANGPVALLVAGGTVNIIVTLNQNMGGIDYQATVSLFAVASVSILGNLTVQGITAKTATTVTVSIKSTALVSLDISSLRVEVIALKAVTPV